MRGFYIFFRSTIASLLIVLWLTACTGGETKPEGEGLGQLQEIIQQEAVNKGLPMISMILVNEDGVIWSGGVVQSEKIPNLKPDNKTTYRIGSVSRLFTDIAVMQYVEQGKVDLDVPVTDYLPDFRPENPYGTSITLRMLMSHTSGLVREPPLGNYFDPTTPSLAETVRSLNDTALVYVPGSKVQYSNAGITVIGRVLEKISGEPFSELMQKNLLAPLGMPHSVFIPEERVLTSLPEGYMQNYQGERSQAPTFDLGIAPAVGMFSTMNDLALFMRALIKKGEGVNGRFLQEKTLEEMWTAQADLKGISRHSRAFGIGFILGDMDDEKTISHGGAIYGFSTQIKVVPGRKIGVAISTNLDLANGAVNRLADYALQILMAGQDGTSSPDYIITGKIPEDRAKKLVGLYQNGNEVIRISQRFGDVYLDRDRGMSLRLRDAAGRIVIDDIMNYDENIVFSAGKLILSDLEYSVIKETKPKPVNPAWVEFIGEYGYDHSILYISEKFGKIHALIEGGLEYPLVDLGSGKFQFPPSGRYPNEQIIFERDEKGKVYNASLNGIGFKRRSIGDVGNVFRITPAKPVGFLEREARQATPPEEGGPFKPSDLVDITKYGNSIKLDIRYASTDNFLGTPVYSSAHAFLQRPAAEALGRIAKSLERQGYGLLVHDAYRPWYVSKIFWDATPEESKIFVADPSQGSRHNRGAAIDLTLYDLKTGQPVEMVGLYDEMTPRSYSYYPGGTSLQRWHRDLLRRAMEADGFTVYEYEWWHFDFKGWQNYGLQNDSFEELR